MEIVRNETKYGSLQSIDIRKLTVNEYVNILNGIDDLIKKRNDTLKFDEYLLAKVVSGDAGYKEFGPEEKRAKAIEEDKADIKLLEEMKSVFDNRQNHKIRKC